MQVHHFYNGLSRPTRTLIDASAEGAIMGKNKEEAYQILENIALNDCQWPVERAAPKKPARVFDLDMFINLSAQVFALSKQLVSDTPEKDEAQKPMYDDKPVIPYPQRLRKNILDKQFGRFMDIFKKLHINILFA